MLIKPFFSPFRSKIVELEEELRVVGNNLKSLEVSEEKVKSCVIRRVAVEGEFNEKKFQNICHYLSIAPPVDTFYNFFNSYQLFLHLNLTCHA